jgi:hypothetical protein
MNRNHHSDEFREQALSKVRHRDSGQSVRTARTGTPCSHRYPAKNTATEPGQLYRDHGLKWEKILRVKPRQGVDAIYPSRITQSRRCTAYRDGDFMRLLAVAPDHDSTYGRR